MSLSQSFKLPVGGFVVLILVGVSAAWAPSSLRADEQAEARAGEIRELVEFLSRKGFYALRDPQEKEAIAKLKAMSEQAAPAIAEMLTEGLKNRERGWIEVYRPLFILESMGPSAKVALADISKALEDEHQANVTAAARVLERIGPAAKNHLPSLRRVWESPNLRDSTKQAVERAIKNINPESAEKLGIK